MKSIEWDCLAQDLMHDENYDQASVSSKEPVDTSVLSHRPPVPLDIDQKP